MTAPTWAAAQPWLFRLIRTALAGMAAIFLVSGGLAQAGDLPAENNPDWALQTESGNIRIYTVAQPGSSFEAFKAVVVLDAPLENVMAVMANPRSCVDWVYNCSESYGFGGGEFRDRYAYSVNDMPWPVTDRDYVLHIRTRADRATGEVVMNLNATPNQRAEVDGRVRVDQSDTLYRFTPEGDKTRMVWVQHTDPNGALPGWLVNNLLVDIPVRSMEALETLAQKPEYQGFHLVWDDQDRLAGVAKSGDDAPAKSR